MMCLAIEHESQVVYSMSRAAVAKVPRRNLQSSYYGFSVTFLFYGMLNREKKLVHENDFTASSSSQRQTNLIGDSRYPHTQQHDQRHH